MARRKGEPKTRCDAVEFHLKPSRQIMNLVLLLHVLAMVSVWLSGLISTGCITLSLLIGLSSARCLRMARFSPTMRYTSSSGWEICYSNAGFVPMTIMQSTTMGSIAIFLSYKTTSEANAAVMIVHDSLSADDFRRLNVWLRITSEASRDR